MQAKTLDVSIPVQRHRTVSFRPTLRSVYPIKSSQNMPLCRKVKSAPTSLGSVAKRDGPLPVASATSHHVTPAILLR